MNRVTVKVNSYEYTIVCSDSEESKINSLADDFINRLKSLDIDFKKFSQSHAFLTLGLILLDEINELKNSKKINSIDTFTEQHESSELNDFLNNLTFYLEKIKKSLNKIEIQNN